MGGAGGMPDLSALAGAAGGAEGAEGEEEDDVSNITVLFICNLSFIDSCTNIESQDDLPELEEADGKSKIQEVS